MGRLCSALALALAACATPPPPGEEDDDGSSGPAECGSLACTDALLVSLVAEADVLQGGTYAIGWSKDGIDDDCSFTIAGEAEACAGDPPCAIDSSCDAEFGFASMPQFISLAIDGAPALFEITVLRDGSVLLEDGFAPLYEQYHPNGDDCLPVCARGSASLDLP